MDATRFFTGQETPEVKLVVTAVVMFLLPTPDAASSGARFAADSVPVLNGSQGNAHGRTQLPQRGESYRLVRTLFQNGLHGANDIRVMTTCIQKSVY